MSSDLRFRLRREKKRPKTAIITRNKTTPTTTPVTVPALDFDGRGAGDFEVLVDLVVTCDVEIS